MTKRQKSSLLMRLGKPILSPFRTFLTNKCPKFLRSTSQGEPLLSPTNFRSLCNQHQREKNVLPLLHTAIFISIVVRGTKLPPINRRKLLWSMSRRKPTFQPVQIFVSNKYPNLMRSTLQGKRRLSSRRSWCDHHQRAKKVAIHNRRKFLQLTSRRKTTFESLQIFVPNKYPRCHKNSAKLTRSTSEGKTNVLPITQEIYSN